MPMQVCMGATMMCSFGMAPSSLVVLPTNMTFTGEMPDANIMDNIPLVNIMPFGMCMSPANPMVAAATGGVRGTHSDALHPRDSSAVGARGADGNAGGNAYAGRHFPVDVYVGRRYHVCRSRRIYRDGAVGSD